MMKTQKLKVAQVGVANFGKYRRDRMRESGLFDLAAALKPLGTFHSENGSQINRDALLASAGR
jgi:hypothetical protein